MSSPTIALFVSFKAREGHERELQEVLLALAHTSLQEPGCAEYRVHTDLDDATRIWLYELWSDEAALAAHDQTEHVAQFVRRLPELSEAGFERWRTTPLRHY